MIAIIRISGKVGIKSEIEETLSRLRLKRKYVCSVMKEKPENLGMLKKIRNHAAFGKINKETLNKLIKERGRSQGDKRVSKDKAEKISSEIFEGKIEKKLSDFNIKPFFRLHPPRGGIKSKLHFPKGVLGNHGEKINQLIERML